MTAARIRPFLIAGVLALAACGGSDSDDATEVPSTAAPQDTADDASGQDTGEAADEAADDPASEDAGDSGASAGTGTATLTLDNGETYEFSVLCSVEPQMAAGSEILFTATSYDDPSLDITQFGDEGAVTDIATVTVYDATSFDSLWGASSIYEPFGGGLELTIDGSTISGVGTFFAGDDPVESPNGVNGDVVANC
jgi:hypothetical protein